MSFPNDPKSIDLLEQIRKSIAPGEGNASTYSSAFNHFIDVASKALLELGHTNPYSNLKLKYEDLTSVRDKEVRIALHRYNEMLRQRAAGKRRSEYYQSESDALFLMDVNMRGFIEELRISSGAES